MSYNKIIQTTGKIEVPITMVITGKGFGFVLVNDVVGANFSFMWKTWEHFEHDFLHVTPGDRMNIIGREAENRDKYNKSLLEAFRSVYNKAVKDGAFLQDSRDSV